MKTNNLVLVSVGVIMIAAIAVSFLIAKPISMTKTEVPVFMGEGIRVQRAVEGVRGVEMAKEGVRGQEKIMKATPAPMPIVPPGITYRVMPQYPVNALEKGLEGTVLLSVYVGLTGQPQQVQVKSSSGLAEFDQSAISAVSQWKFNPASQAGAALSSWFEIPVSFKLLEG